MQFASIITLLAAAPIALAVEFTNSAFVLTPNTPFTFSWAQASGPVTIVLNNGPALNLKPVETITTIAAGASSGTFTWTPPATLTSDTYAFSIVDSTNVINYSVQFQYFGAAASSTASVSASTTASALSTASTATVTSSMTTTSAATTSKSTTTSMSTTTSGTSTSKTTSASASASTTSTPNTSDSQVVGGSSLALVLVAVASFIMFN